MPEQPINEPNASRVTRRDLLAGAVGAAGGAIAREAASRLEAKKPEIKLPLIMGFAYEQKAESKVRALDSNPAVQQEVILLKPGKEPNTWETAATAKTNDEGIYYFAGLNPGNYRVDIRHAGGGAVEAGKSTRDVIEITPKTTVTLGPFIGKLI